MAKKKLGFLNFVLSFQLFSNGKYKQFIIKVNRGEDEQDEQTENLKNILLPLSGLVNGKIKAFKQDEFNAWEKKGFKRDERPIYNVFDENFNGEFSEVELPRKTILVAGKYDFMDKYEKIEGVWTPKKLTKKEA